MTYLSYTWGGNDDPGGTYGTYDIYCNDGYYPPARATADATPKYPLWVVYVGVNVAAGGPTSAANATGHFVLGGITTNGFAAGTLSDGSSFVNAPLVYDNITGGGSLVYSGSSATKQKLTWVNTSTWGCWAGRSTSTSYTTYYGTSGKTGQMGGGVRYYTAPSEPTGVTATPSTTVSGRIDISWTVPAEDGGSGTNRTASSEINAYSIYRSTSASGTYTLVEKVLDTSVTASNYLTATYADTSTKSANTSYYYKIAAHNVTTDKVSSTTTGLQSTASAVSYSPQVPNKPIISTISASDTNSGTISISYSSSVTSGSPAISSYDIYRNGSKINTSAITSTTYIDTTAIPGTTYSYTVIANNSIGSSVASDSASAEAPGAPAEPSSISVSATARNVVVSCGDSSNDYGKAVTAYYVQYQSASTQNGTYSSWSTPVLMTDKSYQYVLLDPALWYNFRVYAKNSIIKNSSGVTSYYPDTNSSYTANFKTTSSSIFVVAGGKRLRYSNEDQAGTFQPSTTVKRFDGANWVNTQTAKRFDGTNWIELT